LPNVTIHSSKLTLVDKETQVGRWKLIEQELADRGLPLEVHSA